jgi:Major Facilitator Superfamily
VSPGAEAVRNGRGSSFWADLRAVLAERDFRKLFVARLVSQTGDGVFNAGFAAYAFFSATTFPTPYAAVAAFAVLYLPYSVIGPFAGVFMDRWSRQQIIVVSGLVRAALGVITGFIVLAGQTGVPLYISALVVLAVSRFFLAAISAATPRVVPSDKLVMANAIAPPVGTIVSFVGGLAGLGVHLATGGGLTGSAAVIWFAAACYLAAGLTGLRMARGLLGPDRAETASGRTVTAELRGVASGLADGLRHLSQRRKAAYALASVAAYRALYGTLLMIALLLYRNYFFHGGNGNEALGSAALLVAATAIGYGLAAFITPDGVRRRSKSAWITGWLAIAGIATIGLGPTFSKPAYFVLGFVLGLSAQCAMICVDTILQEEATDDFRGRMFALEDMLYNTAYVAGPAIAAPFVPDTGKSYPLVLTVGALYLASAVVYAALTRTTRQKEQSPPARPTQPAQR